MFLLRTTTPSGDTVYFKKLTTYEGRKTTMITGFQQAATFDTREDAAAKLDEWEATERAPEGDRSKAAPIDIVRIEDIPAAPSFKDGNPLAVDCIPDAGREVELIYRDGSKRGVSGDFLRNEMLAGFWVNDSPMRVRWRYITPARFLGDSARKKLEEEKRHVTEDILGDFGFRLVWSVSPHWADVTAYEISVRSDSGVPEFDRKGAQCLPDPVPDIADAEEYLSGHVKWDGCTELQQGTPHWCGPMDMVKHCELIKHIYIRANELMARDIGGGWDAAEQEFRSEVAENGEVSECQD